MKKRTERDFWIEMSIRETLTQSHFAELAYRNINPKAEFGMDAVFSSIHSFLSHCTMVSKMLSSKDQGTPSKSIGDILGISKSSMIHNRKFRNNLEHYNERLKQWIREKDVSSTIGTYNIGPKSMIGIPNMIFVSHYDPSNNTFTFVNEDFDLDLMFEEVQKIKNIANNWVHTICGGKK